MPNSGKADQICLRCATHPMFFKPQIVSYRHEYSPSSVEVGILQEIDESTKLLRRQLENISHSSKLSKRLKEFIEKRRIFVMILSDIPEVEVFRKYVLLLGAEVEKEIEMLEKEREVERIETLEEELEEQGPTEEKEELETDEEAEEQFEIPETTYNSLLDAVGDAINKEKENESNWIEKTIDDYVREYLGLVKWLVNQLPSLDELNIGQDEYQKLLVDLITLDTMQMANKKVDLGTERSVIIPLDLSPLRLPLAALSENTDWNRILYPPLLLLWKNNVCKLTKPYRTLDGHPIMIYSPEFQTIPERSQEEVSRALKNFRDDVHPLIGILKGLTPLGRRGTAPTFIRDPLVQILSLYLKHNPMSIDNLKIVDLGCGSGVLLRDIYHKLLDDKEIGTQISIHTLLNDIEKEPGRVLIRDCQKEEFVGKLELYLWTGDMRNLIGRAFEENENFDIAFINRVFDLYGGYGIFRFDKKAISSDSSQAAVKKIEKVSIGRSEKFVAFSGAMVHEQLWRAMNLLLNQTTEMLPNVIFLPAIDMNMVKNFFAHNGQEGKITIDKLLSVVRLLVISVFPGSFATLFPGISDKDGIFHFEIPHYEAKHTYSVICLSKDKTLINYIKNHF